MKHKIDWIIHAVCNGLPCADCGRMENSFIPGACNFHTHGLAKYGHPDLQIVIDYPPQEIARILNTLGLRHNNLDPEGKQYKAFVANMTNEELEHWYDETYQMCLLAFLRIEHIERKKAINELKKKVEAKDGNT